MARSESIELSADQTFADAAATVIEARGRELVSLADGVLDTSDIERVHDMRVATRRLRAALEVFEGCFPRKLHRRVLGEVKRLADGLGERRDRDVAIDALTRFSEQMHVPDRRGLLTLVKKLEAEQAAANDGLAPLVKADRLNPLREGLNELVSTARLRAGAR